MPFSQVGVGSWTSWTPSVNAGSGSLSSASATGTYNVMGRTVFLQATITITTNGTGASSIQITFPTGLSPRSGGKWAGSGYREDSPFEGLKVAAVQSASRVIIATAAGSYPATNGTVLNVLVIYEL